MRHETYKVVARVKAWMALKNATHHDLAKSGVNIGDFQDFIDEHEDGVIKNDKLIQHVALALNADIKYLLKGKTPYRLIWRDRLALRVFQAYHEFYSRELRAARFTSNAIMKFVNTRLAEHREQIYSPTPSVFLEDIPGSISKVAQDFTEWCRKPGGRE
jgi:hypothetical protein